MIKFIIPFVLYIFFVCSTIALGQGIFLQEALDQDLKVIKTKTTEEEAKLTAILKTKENLKSIAITLSNDLQRSQQEKKDLAETISSYNARIQLLEKQKQNISQVIDELSSRLKLRVIGLYKMQRRMSALEYLSEAKSAHDFQRRGYYLDMLSVYDRDVIRALNNKKNNLIEEKLAVEKAQADQTVLLEKQARIEEDLTKKQKTVDDLLLQVGVLEKSQEQSLDNLKGSAIELEGVLAALMGQTKEIKTPEGKKKIHVAESYVGRSLRTQKGQLLYPVDGKIVRKFGQQLQTSESDNYQAEIMLKGVEFKAPVGGVVRAVASGKVVFSQVLPMYGNVIILDHGGRYYSLYGKIASALAKVDSTVRRGEVVAVLGQGERQGMGANFYFELRFEGKAINPTEYLEPN